jgi:hypothetical protein
VPDLATPLVNPRRIHTRRLVGFDVERGDIDGVSVCRMFNRAIVGQSLPKRVSTDQTHYSVSTVGWPTCASWQSRRSSRFRTRQFRTRSSNG